MKKSIPSPAIAVVGRHNSGKTTLVEGVIAELSSRGFDVGAIKHHSHVGFDIDYPGKDSYRHRQAGASEVVIASPDQIARIRSLEEEISCSSIVHSMPGHDIILVEGYRKSGLPTIEVMRAGNPADARVAELFIEGSLKGWSLDTDWCQAAKLSADDLEKGISAVVPGSSTVAIATDIPGVAEAAARYNIASFDIGDKAAIANFIESEYCRPRVTVVIQAGGESRRMGQSKATVQFAGRPLICRLIERLHYAADELIITTNEPENLAFVQELYPAYKIRLVPDEMNVRGALPGLYTALKAASNPYVAIVACDMIFASARLVVAEALAMQRSDADAVIPVNKHGYESFHALYRKESCLAAVKAALDRGDATAKSYFQDITIREFTKDEVLDAEPRGGCFVNANTPDELRVIEDAFIDSNRED